MVRPFSVGLSLGHAVDECTKFQISKSTHEKIEADV